MIPFSRLRNQSTERLNNLLKVTQQSQDLSPGSQLQRLCYQPLNSCFLSAENKKGEATFQLRMETRSENRIFT